MSKSVDDVLLECSNKNMFYFKSDRSKTKTGLINIAKSLKIEHMEHNLIIGYVLLEGNHLKGLENHRRMVN